MGEGEDGRGGEWERGRMKSVRVRGNVDENHRLSVDLPPEIPPGPVTVLIVPPEDEAGGLWADGVAREGADELSDRARGHLHACRRRTGPVYVDEIYRKQGCGWNRS